MRNGPAHPILKQYVCHRKVMVEVLFFGWKDVFFYLLGALEKFQVMVQAAQMPGLIPIIGFSPFLFDTHPEHGLCFGLLQAGTFSNLLSLFGEEMPSQIHWYSSHLIFHSKQSLTIHIVVSTLYFVECRPSFNRCFCVAESDFVKSFQPD